MEIKKTNIKLIIDEKILKCIFVGLTVIWLALAYFADVYLIGMAPLSNTDDIIGGELNLFKGLICLFPENSMLVYNAAIVFAVAVSLIAIIAIFKNKLKVSFIAPVSIFFIMIFSYFPKVKLMLSTSGTVAIAKKVSNMGLYIIEWILPILLVLTLILIIKSKKEKDNKTETNADTDTEDNSLIVESNDEKCS